MTFLFHQFKCDWCLALKAFLSSACFLDELIEEETSVQDACFKNRHGELLDSKMMEKNFNLTLTSRSAHRRSASPIYLGFF